MKYLVIGDIMLDRFVHGRNIASKMEMNAPVVLVESESENLGGAGNVACNLARLGEKVFLVGILGDDNNGRKLLTMLQQDHIDTGGIFVSEKSITTVKTRVIDNTMKQYIRYDLEEQRTDNAEISEFLQISVKRIISQVDCVIISDYQKGVCNVNLYTMVKELCKKLDIPLLIDSKCQEKDCIRNTYLLSINQAEFYALTHTYPSTLSDLCDAAIKFLQEMNLDWFVLKCAEKGVLVFEKDFSGVRENIPSSAKQLSNPTGAGDTFLAVLAICISKGEKMEQAVRIANSAAGVVVDKSDVYCLCVEELKEIMCMCQM